LLVLLAALVGQRLRRRRLGRFGDYQVLGVSAQTARRTASALLLGLGIACVAAIPADPYREPQEVAKAIPLIEVVLDFSFSGEARREAESRWEDLCAGVDQIVELSRSARFSVYGPGKPLELLIPDTLDVQGVLLILNGTYHGDAKGAPDNLPGALAALLHGRAEDRYRRVIVVSTRTREELTRLWLSEAQPMVRPLFLRMTAETESAEYGIPTVKGGWSWSRQPEFLRGYLTSSLPGDEHSYSPWKRFSAIQLFAFAGFFLLSAEFIYPLFIQSSAGGRGLG